MKKRFMKSGALLLALLAAAGVLMSACAGSQTEPQITLEQYPVTQGSNPTRIISEKIFERFTGLDDKKGDYYKIRHTGTSAAYGDFLAEDKGIEMIIAQQPDPVTEKTLENTLFKPIAYDALVFITNKDNPVDSLTLEQLKGILSGDITNWRKLGGNDEPINLFVRNEAGGSQILLDKYVLKGDKIKRVPKGNVANDMRDMSKYVAEKTGEGATLGYTTYYFAEYSGKRDDIKTLRLDGVRADFDSIHKNKYPLISNIYIGIKSLDSPAGEIYKWITGPMGQTLIRETGYVPVSR